MLYWWTVTFSNGRTLVMPACMVQTAKGLFSPRLMLDLMGHHAHYGRVVHVRGSKLAPAQFSQR